MVNVLQIQKEVVDEFCKRFLSEFMDVLIMVKMKESGTSGYDIIKCFHEKFDFLVSPGTVYSVLYTMERNGLVRANVTERKRIYSLTAKGEAKIRSISESSEILEKFFSNFLENSKLTRTEVVDIPV